MIINIFIYNLPDLEIAKANVPNKNVVLLEILKNLVAVGIVIRAIISMADKADIQNAASDLDRWTSSIKKKGYSILNNVPDV